MAHAITFDIFQCANELKKAGFTEVQVDAQVKLAKAQVEFIKEQTDAINETIDNNLATKQDIKELDLKIETSKNELKTEIAQMGYKVTMRLGGMIVVAVTVLGFLIQLHH